MTLYRARPWTADEIGERYKRSKRFRALVAKAMRRVGRGSKPSEHGLEFARGLATVANRAGLFIGTKKTPKNPDPDLVLRWMAEYEPGEKWKPVDGTHPYLDAVLGSLIREFRVPRPMVADWNRLTSALAGGSEPNPYWFTRDVYVAMLPQARAHRGLVLRYLKIRIPFGFRIEHDPDGNPYATPAEWSYRTLNFDTAPMRKRFGEVWLGVSADGNTLWIASQKVPNITLAQLLSAGGEGITEQSVSYYRPFLEPYATRGRVRGENTVPAQLKPKPKPA